METEYSLPYLQELVIGPYTESHKFSLHFSFNYVKGENIFLGIPLVKAS